MNQEIQYLTSDVVVSRRRLRWYDGTIRYICNSFTPQVPVDVDHNCTSGVARDWNDGRE